MPLASPSSRTGFTLIELVVALVLVALLAALGAPLLRAPEPADSLLDVVARARRLAVERAEPVRLVILADGRWRVASDRAGDATLLDGRLPAPQRFTALALSPVGLCVASAGAAWDPTRCVPADAARQPSASR